MNDFFIHTAVKNIIVGGVHIIAKNLQYKLNQFFHWLN
jgi:hypothetical protein